MTVNELLQTWIVSYDDNGALSRRIEFEGEGWYSYDEDNQVYRKRIFPTFSRIKIAVRKK